MLVYERYPTSLFYMYYINYVTLPFSERYYFIAIS